MLPFETNLKTWSGCDTIAVFLKANSYINKESDGGGGEIRTHGRVAPTTIFKTVAFNRSATPPGLLIITETKKNIHSLMLLYTLRLWGT